MAVIPNSAASAEPHSVERSANIEEIREKIERGPGVSTVAAGTDATPPYTGVERSFVIDGTRDREQPQARVMLVGQHYFDALRIALLQGRVWSADENARGDFMADVNDAFATRYPSSSNALGRRLRVPSLGSQARFQVTSAQSSA